MNQSIIDAKAQVVESIVEKMRTAQSCVVVEYRGLTVAEITELRRELRANNVDFKVYKNSLVRRAATELGYHELTKDLVGPNAIAFGDDAVAPAKVLATFAKEHNKLILKSGVVEQKEVNNQTIVELSKLPNREGMISMLLSCLQSPIRSMACALKAVADSKE